MKSKNCWTLYDLLNLCPLKLPQNNKNKFRPFDVISKFPHSVARNCAELRGIVQNSSELYRIARNCAELPGIALYGAELSGIALNCKELLRIARNCAELPGIVKNCAELLGMARN